MDAGISDFGPAIQSLLAPAGAALHTMPLVPSGPRECPELEALRAASDEDLLGQVTLQSASNCECLRSGLFLYFSALDESHSISQRIPTASGSYWHGIMHRQEGDWSNAKYWFRRTGSHPVFAELEQETGRHWDPLGFVDRCAAASSRRTRASSAEELQMLEWRLLLRHCYRRAVGQ